MEATSRTHYDVIVVGGGPAGIVGALQAARAGANTLLIEKTGILGGNIVNSDVQCIDHFAAWGRQIVGGIPWQLVRRVLEEAGTALPDFTQAFPKRHMPRVNGPLFACISDEMLGQAGADVLFHVMPAAVARHDGRWQVTACGKTGLFELTCLVLIDCTGDANAVDLAGFDLVIPQTVQPCTYCCQVSGYDPAALDMDALTRAYQEAIAGGELQLWDGGWDEKKPNPVRFLTKFGSNANHIPDVNARDSQSKTKIENQGRQSILRLVRWLRRQPGLQDLRIDRLCPEGGVRETAVIRGETTITLEDYESGRVFEDALACVYYPVDLHGVRGGFTAYQLKEGTIPTIPRGALIPAGSENLLAAGRCVSSDRLANSGLRVEASCMAMGQAVGAMAELTARTGITPSQLPLDDIRELLKTHGAILPGDLGLS